MITEETTQDKTVTTDPQDEQVTLDDLFPNNSGTVVTPPVVEAKPAETTTPPKVNQEQLTQHINTQVSQGFQQVNKTLGRQTELATFFNSEEGKMYQPYMKQIQQVATDPRFVDLKLDRVVGMALTPTTLLKIGAKMAKEAETQANNSQTGGSGGGTRGEQAPIDYSTMSAEDFEKVHQDALQGKFSQK